ncbi:MAG: hypothetical protein H6861_08290 [Rhodospirillales bacterium]|nr:hypothetical protein [Rhodospirillales bacterium]
MANKRAYGSNASLLLARETVYGQKATGNYWKMPFNSNNLGAEQDLTDDPVLGFGRDPLSPIRDIISDTGDIVVPLDPRYLGFWLTGLFGDPISADVPAEGSIAFDVFPDPNDTITLNGTVFTFVSGPAAGDEIEIQGTLIQTLDEAVTVLNASTDNNVNVATYSRQTGTEILTIIHDTAGAGGNDFTLAASKGVVSAGTLQGGGTEHKFVSGKQDLPSYSLEVGMPEVPAYFVHLGTMLNSIAFDFQQSGAAAATINAIAQGEDRFAVSQGGTPQSLAFKRIGQFHGAIKSGGERLANVTGASVTYSNNLETIPEIRDDLKIGGSDPTIGSLTGSIETRFANTELLDKAIAGTPIDLEFSYTPEPGLRIVVEAHEANLKRPKTPVSGPGGIQAGFDFQCSYNETAGQMLTVRLINDLDGSQYA